MSHLDEGLVHAYLDNELDLSQRREADRHLSGCAQCRQLLEEAQGFMAEADRLVAAIELPLAPVRAAAVAHMAEVRKPELAEVLPVTDRRAGPPQLRWVAWAATVVVAVGLGYFSNELRHTPSASDVEADKTLGGSSATGAVLDTLRAESVTAPAATAQPGASDAAAPLERSDQGERRGTVGLAEAKPGPLTAGSAAARKATVPESSSQHRDELATSDAVIAPAPPASPAAKMASPQSAKDQGRAGNALRPVALEEAVRLLGGTVRLIDGMTPKRVLAGSAESGPGAMLIRVVYEDPPGRELWLDQQRHRPDAENSLRASSESNAPVLLSGDTLVASGPGAAARIQWVDQDLFRLTLTGYLPSDSLRTLVRRVR